MQPHDFWQEIHSPGTFRPVDGHIGFFPAELEDGRQIKLPIRPLPDGEHALASLIINQASFVVQDALGKALAAKLEAFKPDIVVGLPTLGLTLASAVARDLGHGRYVPLGTSRKFWYAEEYSVSLSSITTPDQRKRLYADPRMLPLLEGQRVALIDDVISSGASMLAGLQLLATCRIDPVVLGVAMIQTQRWRHGLDVMAPGSSGKVIGVFNTPMLTKTPQDHWVEAE